MKFISFFVKRPITALMLNLFFLGFGIFSYYHMPITLFPDARLPQLTVFIPFENEQPQEVEDKITVPIEDALGTLPGLEKIESQSQTGYAFFKLKFAWEIDIEYASMEVHERIKKLSLPSKVGKPLFWKWSPSEFPILEYDVSSSLALTHIKDFVDYEVLPDLQGIEGIASIEVNGTPESRIEVICDSERLVENHISILQVIGALEDQGKAEVLGNMEEAQFVISLVVKNFLKNKENIENIYISRKGLSPITLKEIATVTENNQYLKSYSRTNGEPSVSLAIKKSSWANSLTVIKDVKNKISYFEKKYPHVKFLSSRDDSVYIKDSRSIVLSSLVIGVLLAGLMLFLFLRDWRVIAITNLSIPISLFGSGIILYMMGISQNVFTLAGLALASGNVSDASIVILDNIMRLHKKGMSIHSAAIEGAAEMIPSIIASVLTNIAVFVPVTLCIKGLMGILFWDLSFAVIWSMLLSLVVCFTFIPVAVVSLFQLKSRTASLRTTSEAISSLPRWDRHGFFGTLATIKIQDIFASKLKFLLENLCYRKWVVRGVYVLCFLCLVFIPGRDLLPPTIMRSVVVELEHPHNLTLSYADKETHTIENILKKDSFISKFASRIEKEKSFVYIDLKEGIVKRKEAERYLRGLREKLGASSSSKIYVYHELKLDTTEGAGFPVEVQVYQDKDAAPDDEGLNLFADSLKGEKDLIYVNLSSKRQASQIHVTPEKRELHELGLSSQDISKILQAHLYGKKIEGVHEDVLVKGDLDRQGLENLPLYVAPYGEQGVVRSLASLAHFTTLEQEKIYERSQKKPVVKVLAHLAWDRISLGNVLQDIRKHLSRAGLDSIVSSSLHLMESVFSDLYVALLLAIVLIFIIMATLFESLVHSFVMLLSIPLAIIGVWVGLFLSGQYLNVSVMLGAIILVGTVVSNAIILIDTINAKRRAGEDRNHAIVTSVQQRTRPIIMTMLTSVLGTLPLVYAKGAASEMYNGLAVVVVSGLATSTFLTLILIPLVYVTCEDFLDSVFRYFLSWKTKATELKGGA